jgi:phosphinothricin acetyltransferase
MSATRRDAAGTHPPMVRASTPTDLSRIQAIYAHHVLHGVATFEEVPPAALELGKRRDAVLSLGLPHLVAMIGSEVVGYAYAAPFHHRAAYRYTLEDSIYVDVDLVGRGIGETLLTTLIAQCEQGPWRQLIAVIGDSGNAGSIGLHRKCGFRHVGTMPTVGFKFGRWVDTVHMQRELGDGNSTLPT